MSIHTPDFHAQLAISYLHTQTRKCGTEFQPNRNCVVTTTALSQQKCHGDVSEPFGCPCLLTVMSSDNISASSVYSVSEYQGRSSNKLVCWLHRHLYWLSLQLLDSTSPGKKEASLVQCFTMSCLHVQVWHMLTRDHTVLPANHMLIHNQNEPYLPLLLTGSHFPSQWG